MMSENENEKRDTVVNVFAEYRNDADAMDRGELYQPTTEYLRRLLDRLEAAWEREREELDKRISDLKAYAKLWTGRADELRLKCDEFYAKAKPVGNAAAMRDALEAFMQLADDGVIQPRSVGGADEHCFCVLTENANAALSAPARNVDKFTSLVDALNAWRETPPNESWSFDEWLFAPAEERKGEGK